MQITDPAEASRIMLENSSLLLDRVKAKFYQKKKATIVNIGHYVALCDRLLHEAKEAKTPYLQLCQAKQVAIQVANLAILCFIELFPNVDLSTTEIYEDLQVIRDQKTDWNFIYDQKMFHCFFAITDSAKKILDFVIDLHDKAQSQSWCSIQ